MIKPILFTIMFSTFLFANTRVCVSIAPQAFFVEKIAGDLVETTVLIPPGASPATYSAKPSQLNNIKESSLYFTIGVPFEKNWLERFRSINPQLKIIDTTKGIDKLPMAHEVGHHEDLDHHHEKGELDPHVWLSPSLVKKQALIIKNTLCIQDPQNSAIYEKNYQAFIQQLDTLQQQISTMLQKLQNREFIVFHPSFGYFAKDFNLTQIAIEKEGKEPSLKYLNKVITFAKKHHIKTIFVAPQFSQKSAQYIAKRIQGTVQSINPLSKAWDKNLIEIAQSFEKTN